MGPHYKGPGGLGFRVRKPFSELGPDISGAEDVSADGTQLLTGSCRDEVSLLLVVWESLAL